MENEMNFKRVMMILLAAMLLPGMALAQTTTRATFTVYKNFTDDNPATASVTLNCFTGLPLTQSQDITDSQEVTFIVESFQSGSLDCSVSEEEVTGYTTDILGDYYYSGNCEYEDVSNGASYECYIDNSPTPVEVTVTKDWEVDGSGGNALDPTYSLTLWCDNEIEDGSSCDAKNGGYYDSCYYAGPGTWYKDLTEYGTGDTDDEDYTAHVVPDWEGGTDCWVEEEVWDSSVEVDDSDCVGDAGLDVELAGEGDIECTIVNTVFYEGIPTLSQYGMAIMALLMLGVGFVGFRRFV
jgi:IPTL-CTERM motif